MKTDKMDKKTLEILERVMLEAKKESDSDGASLYVYQGNDTLRLVRVVNDILEIDAKSDSEIVAESSPIFLHDKESKEPNDKDICAVAFLNKDIVNIADAYIPSHYDLSSILSFDEKNNYRSTSLIAVPVPDNNGQVVAVILLVNAKNAYGRGIPFSPQMEKIVSFIVKNAAPLMENNRMENEHKRFMESFVRIIAKAVDDKSTSKSMHCQKVPLITKKLVSAVYDSDAKAFEKYGLSEDNRYALQLASWLYDCGKLAVPEYMVDKATKLETVRNRIHEIRTRFEVLLRDARIKYLESVIKNPDDEEKYREAYKSEVSALRKEFTFVAKCNLGDVVITERGVEKIKQIAKRTYIRNFDGTLGLSKAEVGRLNKEEAAKFPVEEHLLQDKKEDIIGDCNCGEVHNLIVKYGTLTAEEKNIMDKHVEQTEEMLSAVRFPERYRNVVKYAASHHERLDGTGYPKGLKGDKLPLPVRILTMADVFEALSADDRPYKKMRKLSEILKIMKNMSDSGHLDPDIFHIFVKKKIYSWYAKDFMKPEQLDKVDEAELLKGYDEDKDDLQYPVASDYATFKKVKEEVSSDIDDDKAEEKDEEDKESLPDKADEDDKQVKDLVVSDKKTAVVAMDTIGKDDPAKLSEFVKGPVESYNTESKNTDAEADKKESDKADADDKSKKDVKAAEGKSANPEAKEDEKSEKAEDKESDKVEEKEDSKQSSSEATGKTSNDDYLAKRMAEDRSASDTSVLDDTSLFSEDDGNSKLSPSELVKMAALPPLLDGEDDDKTPVFSSDSAFKNGENIADTQQIAKAVTPIVIAEDSFQDLLDGDEEDDTENSLSIQNALKHRAEDRKLDLMQKEDMFDSPADIHDSDLERQYESQKQPVQESVKTDFEAKEPSSVSSSNQFAKPVASVNRVTPVAQQKQPVKSVEGNQSPRPVVGAVRPSVNHNPVNHGVATGNSAGQEQENNGILKKITHFFNPPKVVRSPMDTKGNPPSLLRKGDDEDSSVS